MGTDRRKDGALPVLRDGQLVGLVTDGIALRVLAAILEPESSG